MGTFKVRKPKVPEGCQEVIVRESPDELTLRAEEVGTSKALINVDHIEEERWGSPLVDGDWCAFCRALYKGSEGEDWGQMYEAYKEKSRAVGGEEATRGPKSKSPLEMKAAKDAREQYYDSTREDNIKGRNETRLALGEEHLKIQLLRWTKPEGAWKISIEGFRPTRWGSPMAGDGSLLSLWKKPIWDDVWPYLDAMDIVRLRTALMEWNVPEKSVYWIAWIW